MEKLNEAIKIEITDDSEMQDEETIEIEPSTEYELILTGTSANTFTDEFNGELKAIIVSASKICNIKVVFTKYPDIAILNLISYQGTNYLPIKVLSNVANGDRINYSSEQFYFKDDTLLIYVEGPINTEVKLEFRVED
jgi:hypothetical protein